MAAAEVTDGLPVPRRYFSAAAIWCSIAMAVLDSAIANIALPTISRKLGASPADAIWIVNAYQLAVTVLLLPLAALGDRIGHHRVYLPGLAIFVLGSLGCSLSDTLPELIAARMLQGIGAAAVTTMNAALIRATYPSAMLGRGIGYNSVVLSLSATLGPTLAAFILRVADWPWLFAINVPLGIAALMIGARSLPRAVGHGLRPDYVSALLSAATLGCIVYGGETLVRQGNVIGLALLVFGLLTGALLVRRERGREAPLVPLDLLRIPIFSLSIATSMASFAAQVLAFVTIPFLFQSVLGHSVVESGLMMTPWPVAVGCVAQIAGRLADRYPAGLLGGAGLALFAAGLFALSMLGSAPSVFDIAWRMALCGAGFGLFQSPNTRAIIAAAPVARSGAAGGMLATARLLGQTMGAVAAAAGFQWWGVHSAPTLLAGAGVVALVAASVSLLRLRIPQATKEQDGPVLDPP